MRHLLDTTDLSLEEVDGIISTAIDIINNKENMLTFVTERNLLHCFLNRQPEHVFRLRLL